MQEEPLALETRRRLYAAIRSAPGLGAREVQRAAGTGWGDTVYQLQRLTDAGLLHRERGGHQDHYFAPEVPFAARPRRRLARSTSARRLLVALLEAPGSTVPDLEHRTGLSPGRISVHLRRLVETGLVTTGRRERWRTFKAADRERIVRLLVEYRRTFTDEWIDRLLETWSELFRP